MLIAAVISPLVLMPFILRRPALAVYVLVACATTLEIFPLDFNDSLTDATGFFLNLNNTMKLPLSASPAELLMGISVLAWWRAQRADPSLRPRGPLFKAYVVYLGVLLLGDAHGLATHGDFNTSLWELRPQVYGFIAFVLAASLIREEGQLLILAAVFVAASALKAAVGYNRYFNTLHGDIGINEAILAHEDSYFLAMLMVAAGVGLVWYRKRQALVVLLAFLPLAFIVLVENRRRVGMLALGAALVIVAVAGVWFEKRVRWKVAAAAVAVSLCYGAFLSGYWNKEYGAAAQLVRPIHSLFEPDQRDFNSNLYRDNEDADLKFTYQQNRLIGVGMGQPMAVVFPLADISQQYPFWQYIPHNTILWIAMRTGVLGMMAFWAMIGMALLEAISSMRRLTSPLVRAAVVFALAGIIAELIVGYGDVQLENYRNMIFFGCIMGLINAAERISVGAPIKKLAWAAVPQAPGAPMGPAAVHLYSPARKPNSAG